MGMARWHEADGPRDVWCVQERFGSAWVVVSTPTGDKGAAIDTLHALESGESRESLRMRVWNRLRRLF